MQRNMAANCGMDYRAAGEFVASIALRELQLLAAAKVHSITSKDADSLCEACRGRHTQAARSVVRLDKGLQRQEGTVLHGSKSQTGQSVEEDASHRNIRVMVAAKLRVKQALPMLEGFLAKVHPEGGSCSNFAVDACAHAEDCSAGCKDAGKYPLDVRVAATPGVSSQTGALDLSRNVQLWKAMDDDSFWQTMLQMTLIIKEHVDESAIDARTSVTGYCKGHG